MIDGVVKALGGGALAYVVILLVVAHLAAFVFWLVNVFRPTQPHTPKQD